MKKILYISFLFSIVGYSQTAPSLNQNFVHSTTYQIPLNQSEVNSLPYDDSVNDQKIESITYYDGLGRPMQSISIRGGSNSEDIMTPIVYDDFGRTTKGYLPLPKAANYGAFDLDPLSSMAPYYNTKFSSDGNGTTINPYSEKIFENSPLNRVLEQGAPGWDWKVDANSDNDHTIKYEYKTNGLNEVRLFTVSFVNNGGDTSMPELTYDVANQFYASATLYKSITKDENWQPTNGTYGVTTEYKNLLGQIVLKRTNVFDLNRTPDLPNYHDTYYIYDDFGNLTFVLSPEASDNIIDVNGNIDTVVLDKLGYQYKYDYRNRLIEKKIPGKGWEYIYYDVLDRPVLTQDANLRADNNKWLFTKYDALGRVVYTGIYTPNAGETRTQIEDNLRIPTYINEVRTTTATTIGNTQLYYTNFTYPTSGSNLEVLTINYYDDYIDMDGLNVPTTVFGTPTTENIQVQTTTKGLPTVSKVKVLETNSWITSLTVYDEKARVLLQRTKNNYLNTNDFSANKLDFTGKVLESVTTHFKEGNPTITTNDYFTYDHMGRLLTQKQKINNEEVQLIASNTYDDLGQLTVKRVGGVAALEGYTDLEDVDISSDGTISKISNAWDWFAKVKTKGEIPSQYDGGLDFTVLQHDKYIRGGLIKSSNSNQPNEYFDYGFDIDYNTTTQTNTIRIIINGVVQNTNYGSYQANDLFRVERVDHTIKFYHNNTVLIPEINISEAEFDAPLLGKVAFYTPSGSINNLTLFGPLLNKVLQTVNYKYNIRGWLTDINNVDYRGKGLGEYNDLFNFRINYNKIQGLSNVVPLYNGNISQTFWKTKNTFNDENIRGYSYIYDNLNRINEAISLKENYLHNMVTNFAHDVGNISYDKNGNISALNRSGYDDYGNLYGLWDELTYTYEENSNKLQKVGDNQANSLKDSGFKDGTNTGDDYTYDDNGNMITDANKDIGLISYNHLNLPTNIDFGVVGDHLEEIHYKYDATGVKLEKTVFDTSNNTTITTQYAGNYIYQTAENGELQLQFFNHPEGYTEPTVVGGTRTEKSVKGFSIGTGGGSGTITYSDYSYVFQFKDHLGNVRLSYSDGDLNGSIDPATEIIEESNYYPFGLTHLGYNNEVSSAGNSLAQNFKFNGKELSQELGLNTYDFGARNYDAALGRWFVVDPLASNHYELSPYNSVANNPIIFIDPDGRDFILSGKKGHVDDYIKILENLTGNTYEMVDGQLERTSELNTETTENISGELSALVEKLITSDDDFSVNLVKNDDVVLVDRFSTGQIDVGDLKKIKKAGNDMQAAHTGHFLEEMYTTPGEGGYSNESNRTKENFDEPHEQGKKKELEILQAMNPNVNLTDRVQSSTLNNNSTTNSVESKTIKYSYGPKSMSFKVAIKKSGPGGIIIKGTGTILKVNKN